MSKVVHRHEVLKAADEAFDGRIRRLENQVRMLESEIAYLKKFHSEEIDVTDVPVFEEPKSLGELGEGIL